MLAKSLLALWLAVGALPAASPSAVEELTRLTQQANAARKSGDLPARLQAVLKVRQLLHDAPNAIEASAQAYLEAGDTERALTALSQFADLGQCDDGLLSGKKKTFAALEKLPRYQSILQRLAENKTAISRAETAFTLSDPGLLAEDIDYDPRAKSFFVSSVLEKKIIRVTPEGKAADFALSPSHWPILALKVDPSRRLLWATEVALDGFTIAPKADWGRSALLCFDLDTGKLKRRLEGPAHSALGDMTLTPEGNPIVSDGGGGGIYRLTGDRLERIDGGDYISPQTPAMYPDGKRILIPDYARGLSILDPTTRQGTWLSQGASPRYALNGIDGLYLDHDFLIAIQNGATPPRVIRFPLDPASAATIPERIIERATATLGDPTHGVVVGEYFYYIANSGWSELDEHGDLKPQAKPTPARIMRYPLQSPAPSPRE